MEKNLIDYTKRLLIAKYPRFGSEIASTKIEYNKNLPYKTAATDGNIIYFDPDYLKSLTDDEKLFVMAHEIMHNKFEHMFRLKDKDGNNRNMEVWNIATDAIINANLEKDGFTIKQGYVNIKGALNYTSEELYNILFSEKQKRQNQQGKDGSKGKNESSGGESSRQNNNGNIENNKDKSSNQNGQNGDNKKQNSHESDNNSSNFDNSNQNGQTTNSNSTNKTSTNSNIEGGLEIPDDVFDRQNSDDHSIWEEDKNKELDKKESIFDKIFKNESKQNEQKSDVKFQESQHFEFKEVDEKSEFDENRKERREIARRKFEQLKNNELVKTNQQIDLGDVGEAKSVLDWKSLLRREVDKTETVWSQRRSIAENNYAYRLEENEVEDEAETEVMIDVSGSVSLDMVKAFLRQLKPVLKHSKLKVGCFNEKYWGMVEIKSSSDINNFKIPADARGWSARTEDWDLAVRSFSKKREVNKIVFTDGNPCPGTMPKDDLRGENVIWLVYSNRNFSPCCGKIIQISAKELEKMQSLYKNEDLSR